MKAILLGVVIVVLVAVAVWFFAPREPVGGPVEVTVPAGAAALDSYLFHAERDVPALRRGTQKHILWHDPARREPTPLSIVYIHGFSASLEEIRPVPDDLARDLGANLYYARLTGHGQDGAALAAARAPDWRRDAAEALAIGRQIGERVLVIGTSTGGSLITLALEDAAGRADVAGVVLVSPNFRVKAAGSSLLDWPFARFFVPLVTGSERYFAPENLDHGKWWTNRYPTVALMPMAAVARAAREAAVANISIPALFIFSDADAVVDATATRAVAARWGGSVSLWPVDMGPRDDRKSHIIAGDILSPSQTDPVVRRIHEWLRERNLLPAASSG